jgi:hypothetical protein
VLGYLALPERCNFQHMQVIFRGAYWLRSWSQLQRDEQAKVTLTPLSKKLEVIALDISNRGWKYLYHLL